MGYPFLFIAILQSLSESFIYTLISKNANQNKELIQHYYSCMILKNVPYLYHENNQGSDYLMCVV